MDASAIIAAADRIRERFTYTLSQSSEYRVRGVFHSEMLAFCAIAESMGLRRILESGRAFGQSTEIVARHLAASNVQIDSVEINRVPGEVAVVEGRLIGLSNVNLHYGSAFDVLPTLLDDRPTGVLIDGPKNLFAFGLAAQLAAHPSIKVIAIHDMPQDENKALPWFDRYFPSNWATDDCDFVARFRDLDDVCWRIQKRDAPDFPFGPYTDGSNPRKSYAGTFLFVFPREPGTDPAGASAFYEEAVKARQQAKASAG